MNAAWTRFVDRIQVKLSKQGEAKCQQETTENSSFYATATFGIQQNKQRD